MSRSTSALAEQRTEYFPAAREAELPDVGAAANRAGNLIAGQAQSVIEAAEAHARGIREAAEEHAIAVRREARDDVEGVRRLLGEVNRLVEENLRSITREVDRLALAIPEYIEREPGQRTLSHGVSVAPESTEQEAKNWRVESAAGQDVGVSNGQASAADRAAVPETDEGPAVASEGRSLPENEADTVVEGEPVIAPQGEVTEETAEFIAQAVNGEHSVAGAEPPDVATNPCPVCESSGACTRCGGKGRRLGLRCSRCQGRGTCTVCGGVGYLWDDVPATSPRAE